MTAEYATLVEHRRPYLGRLTDDTQTAQPVITGDLLHLADGAADALRTASGELPVPELAVPAHRWPTGHHRAGPDRTRPTVDPDYWPWTQEERQAIRWQIRRSLLDNADTGVIPIVPGEVTR